METYKIKNVLMPTDFSELSACAFKVAVALCKRQNAKLTILHVVDSMYYMTAIDANEALYPSLGTAESDYVKSYRQNMEGTVKELTSKYGIQVKAIVEMGNPADTICRVASRDNFDLIVMGTHGASGLREFFMGSNAFSVVKHASCPVLTIPGNWNRTEFKKVVFPIRLLPGAIEKYDYARPIIEKNKSSLLIVGLAERENSQSIHDLADMVNQFKLQLNDDKVDFLSVLYHSKKFPEKVMDESEDFDADLIVITANLDYDLKAFFIGPFAQQIVNHSQRPVLSIRKTINESANEIYLKVSFANWQGQYMQFGF